MLLNHIYLKVLRNCCVRSLGRNPVEQNLLLVHSQNTHLEKSPPQATPRLCKALVGPDHSRVFMQYERTTHSLDALVFLTNHLPFRYLKHNKEPKELKLFLNSPSSSPVHKSPTVQKENRC
ncbi:hypothetical protein ILYODFUR_026711 [Ilyodon furcidens]|uniref:Uncharacterized protein n=1 Tax=Ilyodon furcidens TaxID=33524 RepID=A0ABV0UM91_9TELE